MAESSLPAPSKSRTPEPDTVSPPGEPSTVPPEARSPGSFEVVAALRSGAAPAALPAPFGRYRLERLLGEGGMGSVYLAHDTQLDRLVALKVPRFGPEDSVLRERFWREARAAATLRHPNLCPVFDVGEQDGVHYLTMAYIEGGSLADYLRHNKPLPAEEAAELVVRLARALQEAHDHGIIHRDLKPGNVLMTRKGEPIITDFGLARRLVSKDERITQTGAMLGTPSYMPPEQVNGDVAAMGPTCDIYSLGVILYELLTNRRPFEGPLGILVAQIVLDPPPPLREFRPKLDRKLEAICLKALAKLPEDRFRSMAAFARALEDWLEPADAAPASPAPHAKRRAGLWFLLLCLLFCVTCLLPVGWITVMVSRLFNQVSEGVGEIRHRMEEVRKEQDHLREVRIKEKAALEKAIRAWQPPADADKNGLFPLAFGEFKREDLDDKAEIADLNLTATGRRAAYRQAAGTVELHVYRAKRAEKEDILRRVWEAVTRRGGLPGLEMPNMPMVDGDADGVYMSYYLGPQSAVAKKHGTFVWQDGWLLLARGGKAEEPAAFLKAYLAETNRKKETEK
jgi:serine/threonine protein kinase